MSWVRIDDNAPDHPKHLGVSPAISWYWLRSVCWANRFGTDGRIPSENVPKILRKRSDLCPAIVHKLVRAGLWDYDPETGDFLVHDFLDFQPSKQQVSAKQAAKRERQHRWLTKLRKSAGRDASLDLAPTQPNPTTYLSASQSPGPNGHSEDHERQPMARPENPDAEAIAAQARALALRYAPSAARVHEVPRESEDP